tara:strand:+ start:76868 stop:77044 length:177 start_codon:yes stop_codon:yes gene_type:complete
VGVFFHEPNKGFLGNIFALSSVAKKIGSVTSDCWQVAVNDHFPRRRVSGTNLGEEHVI